MLKFWFIASRIGLSNFFLGAPKYPIKIPYVPDLKNSQSVILITHIFKVCFKSKWHVYCRFDIARQHWVMQWQCWRYPISRRATLSPLHPIPRPNSELNWTQCNTALPLVNTFSKGISLLIQYQYCQAQGQGKVQGNSWSWLSLLNVKEWPSLG